MRTKTATETSLHRFRSRDRWTAARQKHWGKIGLPGYELPPGGAGAPETLY